MSSLAHRTHVRDRASGRNPVMAALDIGSSKITCLISRRAEATDGEPRVAGAGAQSTRGVRSGAVDAEAAWTAGLAHNLADYLDTDIMPPAHAADWLEALDTDGWLADAVRYHAEPLARGRAAHPLVRIVVVEQLYRAASLLANHPYHRA